MILTLRREGLSAGAVIGYLEVSGRKFPTLELPPTASDRHDACLPAGPYKLQPWTRASGEKAFLISNPAQRVWPMPLDAPNGVTDVRSAVFIAAGFTLNDLIGSHVAPGKSRVKRARGWELERTRDAMNEIRTLVGSKFDLALLIEE